MGLVAPAGVSYLADFPSELGRAAEKWSSAERYEESPTEGTRVEGSDADDAAMKAVLDATLEPDETYLTLSSKDFLYAIVDRQNPLYANQSPLMLSGDASQEFALEELADAECVYVLMPRDACPRRTGSTSPSSTTGWPRSSSSATSPSCASTARTTTSGA